MYCVDLGETQRFQTSIYLQNLAPIQPRASLSKFEVISFNFFNRLPTTWCEAVRPAEELQIVVELRLHRWVLLDEEARALRDLDRIRM